MFQDIVKFTKLLHEKSEIGGLAKVTELVTSKKEDNQLLIQHLVAHLTKEHKNNIPECLKDLSIVRMKHLETFLENGEPKLRWNQPQASSPGHPAVELFLRGPRKLLKYSNFQDINDAQKWAEEQAQRVGCFVKISTSGSGKTSFALLEKTVDGFADQSSGCLIMKKEYERLREVFSA